MTAEPYRQYLVLRQDDERYEDLGVHYLSSDWDDVALDFRLELDEPHPIGRRYRLYPVDDEPIEVIDEGPLLGA